MTGFHITPMVKNLLILNGAVFLIANLVGFNSALDFTALRYFESNDFRIYQIITHMFMHGDIMHLFFNMFGLYMFGTALESVWGHKRFLVFYLVCGLGAALFHFTITYFDVHTLQEAKNAFVSSPTPENLSRFVEEYSK